MKKIMTAAVSAVMAAMLLSGCNAKMFGLTYEYSWAQLKMPDGTVVEGKVDRWSDYDGDKLQVKIDGVTYLVHSANVVLRH